MLVVVVVAWVVVAYISGAVSTLAVYVGWGTDSMRPREDTPVHLFHDHRLYKPRIEVVMQEPSTISTTPAWHLTTRKTANNSDKGIADATAGQQTAVCKLSIGPTAGILSPLAFWPASIASSQFGEVGGRGGSL